MPHARKRRRLLAALAAGLSGLGATGEADAPPNIVVLLADDMAHCDLRGPDCAGVPMPNLRSIAENGALFSDAYVASPSCSPSRAALLTGRYPQRFGFEFNATKLHEDAMGLPASEPTLAERLGAHGYATGMVGKWHLGTGPAALPTHRGFEFFFGSLGAKRPAEALSGRGQRVRQLMRQDEPVAETAHPIEAFTREALAFVERERERPFFLYFAYNVPHLPASVPERHLARFASIENDEQRSYAAMLSALDESIGRLLAKLRETRTYENTLLVFLNDNGCEPQKGGCDHGPLRGGKFRHLEGGIRVPFVMQWPARIGRGIVYREMVSALDVAPTALAAAGAEPDPGRPYDGVDLLPYLASEIGSPPHDSLFWRNGANEAARSGRWKLVVEGGAPALFDLSRDPSEGHDLAAERPEVVLRLSAAIDAWEEGLAPPAWEPRVRQLRRNDGRIVEIYH